MFLIAERFLWFLFNLFMSILKFRHLHVFFVLKYNNTPASIQFLFWILERLLNTTQIFTVQETGKGYRGKGYNLFFNCINILNY